MSETMSGLIRRIGVVFTAVGLATLSSTGVFAQAPKTLYAPKVSHPPVIDGQLPEWNLDARAGDNVAGKIDNPKSQVRFALAWDDKYLYFAAEVKDQDVTGDYNMPGDRVYLDDDVEIYLDMDMQRAPVRTARTLQILFGAAGGYLVTTGGPDGQPRFMDVNLYKDVIKAAVKVDGTLGDDFDVDKGYSVEAAIPWSFIKEEPKDGLAMGFNMSSYQRYTMAGSPDAGLFLDWIPGVTEANNHHPKDWGTLILQN